VTDWATISSLATAGGTLVLGIATFASVRSGNRSARIAERALQVGLRPVLMQSRREDPPEKMQWLGGRWTSVAGGRGVAEVDDGVVYLAMSLRNVGSGIAVLQGWCPEAGIERRDREHPDVDRFRLQGRDLYVPPNDVSYWQGALRDEAEDVYPEVRDAVATREPITIYLLYSDHEGGQRAISRFSLTPAGDSDWLCAVILHWYLDRQDPR
jgi:hypothetical protein